MEDRGVFFRQVEGLRLRLEEVTQQRFAEPFGFQKDALVHLTPCEHNFTQFRSRVPEPTWKIS